MTYLPSETNGLYKLGEVRANSGSKMNMSSFKKTQAKAIKSVKMQAAMLGGEVCYISNQHSAIGDFYNPASVSINAIVFSAEKPKIDKVIPGNYIIEEVKVLKQNSSDIKNMYYSSDNIVINKTDIKEDNGFLILNLSLNKLNNLQEFTIIHADEEKIILSGIYTSRKGIKTYYNLFLTRDNRDNNNI